MNNLLSVFVGHDCTFELDQFDQPRLCTEAETIKNAVLFILFLKRGQFPSIPTLGLNIQNRLYSFYDELSENELEDQLIAQCSALSLYFTNGDIAVRKMMYRGMPSLIIHIATSETDSVIQNQLSRDKSKYGIEFFIGMSVNELGELLYNVNSRSSI